MITYEVTSNYIANYNRASIQPSITNEDSSRKFTKPTNDSCILINSAINLIISIGCFLLILVAGELTIGMHTEPQL